MTAQLTLAGLAEPRIQVAPRLVPFVKWPGGKSDELAMISAAAPPLTGRLIDPFVGGASVLLATPVEIPGWANDACLDLVRLFTGTRESDGAVRKLLEAVATSWDGFSGLPELYAELALAFLSDHDGSVPTILAAHASGYRHLVALGGPGLLPTFDARLGRDLPTKFRRMRRVQASVGRTLSRRDLLANLEGAVRSAFYMAIRARYNSARRAARWDELRSADFLFLREFAYASMFRFNARDEFNVPYGGITYNRKSFADKVRAMFDPAMVERLGATEWRSTDFEAFLAEAAPSPDDFVFVDPPYDSDFSAYDNAPFEALDQQRLRNVLEALPAQVMVVIKDTPMIRELYGSPRWRLSEAAKTYMWTIKSRNDRSATHLTITNYQRARRLAFDREDGSNPVGHAPQQARAAKAANRDDWPVHEPDHVHLRGLADEVVAAAAFEAGRALVTENVPDFRRIMAAAEESGDPLPLLIYTTNRRFPCAQAATLGRLVLALDAVSSDPEEPMASFYLRPHED